MKKLLIGLLVIIACLVGCSITDQAVNDYNTCLNDEACLQKMGRIKNISSHVLNETLNAPKYIDLYASIFGVIASAVVGVILGRQKRKEKK